MNDDEAEKIANHLAKSYREQLLSFLKRNPIENLEKIQGSLDFTNNSIFSLLLNEFIKDLKDYDEENLNNVDKWNVFEGRMAHEISCFQQPFIQHFFAYNLLQNYFTSDLTPLTLDYREQLLEKHNITPKILRNIILEFFGDRTYIGKVKHGGKNSELKFKDKAQFLANYNRYQIIIKNARKEKKSLQRKDKKNEFVAKKEALDKYKIPTELINSTFSDDAPSDVALDWATNELEINISRDYAKKLLNKIRLYFKRDYIVGFRYLEIIIETISCNPRDKERTDLLRFTPPDENFVNAGNTLTLRFALRA